ncbi:ATP-binding protein, partial [bacterium]|nr:ATP-binding protein [bacterium]
MTRALGKAINVSLRVIADLSQGLYRSPADALKELISNAYDADSPLVEINFSKDFSSITVHDIGKGMSVDDFIQIMETIGGSTKRSADSKYSDRTSSGRSIVGRIGIGLLSISQIANKLELKSTVSGSDKGLEASIEFDQFASEEARKIKVTELWEEKKQIEIGKYYITEVSGVDVKIHFTTLKLTGIKKVIADKL